MILSELIQNATARAVHELYGINSQATDIPIGSTRKEFEGDLTVTLFNFAKLVKKSPAQVGEEVGQYLVKNVAEVVRFNVIQGFLNIVVSDAYWLDIIKNLADKPQVGQLPKRNERVMVEYSSPNTNKPLHLGHIRNILVGWATSCILEAAGYEVVRTQVINDRGIAICKSMLAWQLYGEGKTPSVTGIKGDHFVGDYYVLFEKKFQEEYKDWQATVEKDPEFLAILNKKNLPLADFYKEFKNDYFNKHSSLGAQAREMLQKWEADDEATVALWRQMNSWVYEGFNSTYQKLGVRFDKNYYESDQYTVGKDIIEDGLQRGVFYQKTDTSVWIDLTDRKLDHKLVLRSDGTSVYITQDIGMARLREKDFHCQKVVYVVADEQNYHFQVLFEILKKLGEPYSDGLFHLSYGMVELPSGRMKSREGTVVDADDLMEEVIKEARQETQLRGSLEGFSATQKEDIIRKIGLAALKFHIIKVNAKKKMVFDPTESVALEGNTGPYVQYAYVRSNGVVKDAETKGFGKTNSLTYNTLEPAEKDLIQLIYKYESVIEEAAASYDPSVIANFCYDLAKTYNKFWHDCPILREDLPADTKHFRVMLSRVVSQVLQHGFGLLGIEMPERM